MATPEEGELYVVGYNKRHERVLLMRRSSFNLDADDNLIYRALEFRDAAKRDGRMFICALVPRWKRPLLKLLGVHELVPRKYHGQ